jgi:hypothetical protein
MRRRPRRVPFTWEGPPPYAKGYLERRRKMYVDFDSLPPKWRALLRNTLREFNPEDIAAYLSDGYSEEYIIASLRHAEATLLRTRLSDYTLHIRRRD